MYLCVMWLGVDLNQTLKTHVFLKGIGLCAQDLLTILLSIVEVGGGGARDLRNCSMRKGVAVLTMNKIFP